MIRAALALAALACAEPTAAPTDTMNAVVNRSASSSSFSINATTGTVYVRLAAPRLADSEAPHAFMHRMFASADAAGARRLVVDLRGVTGTDARLAVPLVHGIVARGRFARAGGLIVVTGSNTFSALQATATLLGQYAAPQFVSDYPAL
ncbi:MAG TPA: hypothetical protein VFK26_05540 [Gemmatimonadaceae bacterium]|nr:hypothetical protein [Gemmatimonadaceae bacterium]